MKTAELKGVELDLWVAKAEGLRSEIDDYLGHQMIHVFNGPDAKRSAPYSPSGWWNYGGPIIERERIAVQPVILVNSEMRSTDWNAWINDHSEAEGIDGPTPLIAAMRAYVASKFGEEVSDEVC